MFARVRSESRGIIQVVLPAVAAHTARRKARTGAPLFAGRWKLLAHLHVTLHIFHDNIRNAAYWLEVIMMVREMTRSKQGLCGIYIISGSI